MNTSKIVSGTEIKMKRMLRLLKNYGLTFSDVPASFDNSGLTSKISELSELNDKLQSESLELNDKLTVLIDENQQLKNRIADLEKAPTVADNPETQEEQPEKQDQSSESKAKSGRGKAK